MKKDIQVIRDSIGKIVSMLTQRRIKVTQRGVKAYVGYHKITGAIELVNIPYLPDDASEEYIAAVQGFLDHEVGHVLFTDQKVVVKAGKLSKEVFNLHNIIEDVFIERKMSEAFPGSGMNLESVRKFFLEKISRPKIEEAVAAGDAAAATLWAVVPAFRAWGGQNTAADFIKDPKIAALVEPLRKRLGDDIIKRLNKLKTSAEGLALAQDVHKLLAPPPPPPPAPPPPPPAPPASAPPPPDGQDQDEDDEHESGQGGETQNADPADDDGTAGKNEEKERDDTQHTDPTDDTPPADDAEPADEQDPDNAAGDPTPDDIDPTVQDDQSDSAGAGDAQEAEDGSGDDETAGGGASDDDEQGGEPEDEEGDQGDGDTGDGQGQGSQPAAGDDAQDDAPPEDDPGVDDLESGEAEQEQEAKQQRSDGNSGKGSDDEAAPSAVDDTDYTSLFEKDQDFDGQVAESLTREAERQFVEASYQIYSTDWDKVEVARESTSAHNIAELERGTEGTLGVMQKQLERAIAAQARKGWNPAQRRGRVAPGSLYKSAVGDDRLFRQRYEQRAKNTAMTLLVDCSGSMVHSGAITIAAKAAFALSSVLERIKLQHEVLGFTTYHSQEMARSMTADATATVSTGDYSRHDAIFMPVFKTFNERLSTTVKARMASMIGYPDFCRCNVDGESLQVAARRLAQVRAERHIIFVLSDGDPNSPPGGHVSTHALRTHLAKTVQETERAGIEVVGIGIQTTAVKTYYPKHVVLNNLESLPTTVMAELTKILLAK